MSYCIGLTFLHFENYQNLTPICNLFMELPSCKYSYFAMYVVLSIYGNVYFYVTYVSSEWEHRWHRHTATCKVLKLTFVLMNASATSTIASSRHPRKVCGTSDQASTYIENLRQHLLLPHQLLSVHTSTTWRWHKASNLKAICHASSIPQCKTFVWQIGLLHTSNMHSTQRLKFGLLSDTGF